MKTSFLTTAMLIALLTVSLTPLQAKGKKDASELLTIGSKAPKLDIENWVSDGNGQFKEVTTFESDKIYIVEFWATWCGPCIASMPQISKMQEKYSDKGVQVISVSSEDLETVEGFLKRKVRGSKTEQTYAELTSNYCLTCDADRSVSKDYMSAAGRSGIPCAFVVGKTGLIEWIGHPLSMTKPLAEIVEGTWDREAFAKTFKPGQMFDAIIKPQVMAAYRAGDFEKAVGVLDAAIPTLKDKALLERLTSMRQALILLGGGEKATQEIAAFLKENEKNNAALIKMGKTIYMMAARDQVDEGVLKSGVKVALQCQKNKPQSADPLELLAHLYHLQGDLDNAIATQKKAIAISTGEDQEAPKGLQKFLDELEGEKKKKTAKKEEEKPAPSPKS